MHEERSHKMTIQLMIFFFHNKNQDIKVTEFLFNKATMSENVNSSKKLPKGELFSKTQITFIKNLLGDYGIWTCS